MSSRPFVIHSRSLDEGQSGELLRFTREGVQWEWMSMSARRLNPGEGYAATTSGEEAAFVILGGECRANWGAGEQSIGKRKSVFDGFPHCLYLPHGHEVKFAAETVCEIAECRVPSTADLEPLLVRPRDVASSLRGGGNASRQIVDIINPDFPADRLVVIEVYTPGGNWSSFPPHKHDVHNPPSEVDLDEIYYFRFQDGEGFAFQHLYGGRESDERTLKTRDGDVVLVHSGYHT